MEGEYENVKTTNQAEFYTLDLKKYYIQNNMINEPTAKSTTAQFCALFVLTLFFFRFFFFFLSNVAKKRNETEPSAEKKQYFSALIKVSLHSTSCFTNQISNESDKQMSLSCFFAVVCRHPEGSENLASPTPSSR